MGVWVVRGQTLRIYVAVQRASHAAHDTQYLFLCVSAQAVISRFGSGRKGAEEDSEAALARLR